MVTRRRTGEQWIDSPRAGLPLPQTGPGLLDEPLNAVTNVAFLIAAALLMRQPRPMPPDALLLPVLLSVVGVRSLSFHTLATGFTGALDSPSILVFVLTALVSLLHWMWGVPWRRAWLAIPVFVVFAVAVNVALGILAGLAQPSVATHPP